MTSRLVCRKDLYIRTLPVLFALTCLLFMSSAAEIFADDKKFGASASQAAGVQPQSLSEFTVQERLVIEASKLTPVKVGIIPDQFPLSSYSEKTGKYKGIILDLLNLVSQRTGLLMEPVCIPIDRESPLEFLKNHPEVSFVAGTIKSKQLLENDSIVLSDKLFDASAVFIGRNRIKSAERYETDDIKATVSVLKGFQAGRAYLEQKYKNIKILDCKSTHDCLRAIKTGRADFAFVNRYVASYFIQQPYFEELSIGAIPDAELENCVAAPEGAAVYISIINKGLAAISEVEYNYVLLNFTVSNPYEMTLQDYIYKFRVTILLFVIWLALSAAALGKWLSYIRHKRYLYMDQLTGLYSRYGFEEEARKLLKKNVKGYYIVDFDIIRFEAYNAAYSRERGDLLLMRIAEQVASDMREGEIAARVYADHFVVMIKAADEDILESRWRFFDNEFKMPLENVSIFLKFGAYKINDRNLPVETMIDRAIVAKRTIRSDSDTLYSVYDEDMHKKSLDEANMVSSLDTALVNGEFFIAVQPKYSTLTGEICGGEALVRWRKPDGALVMPGDFIEVFENNGQIIHLDYYVMELACALQKRICSLGLKPVPVSVNFSRVHIYEQDFVNKLEAMITRYELSADNFEIELTESALIDDQDHVLPLISRLKEKGFTVAMDDFGSGYSSLNALSELPIDVLKFDKEFVRYETEKSKGQEIIKKVLMLAKELSLITVAEGVETGEQLRFLRSCGTCDIIQGYVASRPVDTDAYIALLKSSSKW